VLAVCIPILLADRHKPWHYGTMVQFGENAGARHVKTFGYASSVVDSKKYSSYELFRKDLAVLGVLSYTYNKFLACAPVEISGQFVEQLRKDGLGTISSHTLTEGDSFKASILVAPLIHLKGCGYSLILGQEECVFTSAKRSPPEGYLSFNYGAYVTPARRLPTADYAPAPDPHTLMPASATLLCLL
jgi:hypothetical protein